MALGRKESQLEVKFLQFFFLTSVEFKKEPEDIYHPCRITSYILLYPTT